MRFLNTHLVKQYRSIPEGTEQRLLFTGLKMLANLILSFRLAAYFELTWPQAILASLFVSLSYQYLVSLSLGLTPLETIEMICFVLDTDFNHNNATSIQVLERQATERQVFNSFGRLVDLFPKLRSKIVQVFGDLYWEDLFDHAAPSTAKHEILKKCVIILDDSFFQSEKDLEFFLSNTNNLLMPLDTPQWRAYVVLNYLNTNKTLILWRIHHSIADGSSALCMNMCLSGAYDKNQLMPYRIGKRQRLYAILTMVTYIPTLFRHMLSINQDRNKLKQRQWSSKAPPEYAVALSTPKSIADLKRVSKQRGCTINDLVTLALCQTIFELRENPDEIFSVCMPANIRSQHY